MSKWLEKANNILGKWISMLDLEDILPGPLAYRLGEGCPMKEIF